MDRIVRSCGYLLPMSLLLSQKTDQSKEFFRNMATSYIGCEKGFVCKKSEDFVHGPSEKSFGKRVESRGLTVLAAART